MNRNENMSSNKSILLWSYILIGGILCLYNRIGIIVLGLAIIVNCGYRLKYRKAISDKVITILTCYLPFYTLLRLMLIQNGLVPISALLNYLRDILIIIALFTVVINNKFKIALKNKVWTLFIIAWIFGLVISFGYGNVSIGFAGLHLTVIPMLLFITIDQDKNTNDGYGFINDLYAVCIIVATIGMVAYMSRPLYFRQLFGLAGNEIDARDYVRFVSVFFTPNVCGSFLSIGIAIGLSKFLKKRQAYNLGIVLFLIICLILTLSRGAWLFGLSVILISLVFIKPKYGIPVMVISVIGFFLIESSSLNLNIFGPAMEKIVRDRFLTIMDRGNSSSYGRVNYWLEAFELLKRSPIGYGIGVSSTAQLGRTNATSLLVIDGFYAKTIIELGIMGIIYCICLIIWSLKKSLIGLRRSQNEITIATLLICIGVLIQCIGSNTLDFVCIAPWYWVFLGLSSKLSREEQKEYLQKDVIL